MAVFYGRMAIQKRLKQIQLIAPTQRLIDNGNTIAEKVKELSNTVGEILQK